MRKIRVGVSACFFHADPQRAIFKGKTLLYLEQSMSEWVMRAGAVPLMLPASSGGVSVADIAGEVDALLLQGGSDLCPRTYGQEPMKPEWNGDEIRDRYEIALIREFRAQGKPVLGVCRGLQLINVAYGGTLWQDIGTQVPGARNHRDWNIYDHNLHEIAVEPAGWLAGLFGDARAYVNSVHHQAVRDLGAGLATDARSTDDGIIEAARATGSEWVRAVQWHPEFQRAEHGQLLDSRPIMESFLTETRRRLR